MRSMIWRAARRRLAAAAWWCGAIACARTPAPAPIETPTPVLDTVAHAEELSAPAAPSAAEFRAPAAPSPSSPETQRPEAPADGAETGAPARAPGQALAKLPGPCVDPTHHAAERAHKALKLPADENLDDFVETFSERELDLDGDGAHDALRFLGATSMTSTHLLYVMRGTCGHFVGQIAHTSLEPLPSSRRGLFDLSVHSECQPNASCAEVWRFNGTRYQRVSRRVFKGDGGAGRY